MKIYPKIIINGCHALRHLPLVGITREELDREIEQELVADRIRETPTGITSDDIEMQINAKVIAAGFSALTPATVYQAMRNLWN